MTLYFAYFFVILTATLPTFAFILNTDNKLERSRNNCIHIPRYVSTEVSQSSETENRSSRYSSYIASIRSCNLAGTVSGSGADSDICITLGDEPNMVAVTGETGSGKSLLIAKAADLLTGGKASSSTISSAVTGDTFVEMEIRLSEPHLTMVEQSLSAIGIDPSVLFESDVSLSSSSTGTLLLRRDLAIENERIRSTCAINGRTVSLKALRIVSRPLLVIVDAAAAAAALAKQNSRMSIIDTAVPPPVLSYARLTRAEYRKCRGYRRQLEKELSNRMLPVSISGSGDDDKDVEMLQHWIDELDAFAQRIDSFVSTLDGQATPGSNVATAVERLSCTSWFDDTSSADEVTNEDEVFTSALYTNLVDFREVIKSLEQQVEAARNARDALSSLSLPESAVTALERTRNHLFDAAGNESSDSPISTAAEKSHDLLNAVEEALRSCARSLEDDQSGILTLLEATRGCVQVSLEEIDILLGDWNTLARKHGMSPFALPACHKALKAELSGNVEARLLLPEAVSAEAEALDKFEAACTLLTSARQKVAKQLSLAVSKRLPSLGMEGSTFVADLHAATRNCTDISAYATNARLGTDSIDFLLNHGTSPETDDKIRENAEMSNDKGGKVDVVASSGEKARILLAIECELPGSIGAINRATLWNDTGLDLALEQVDHTLTTAPPVSVIYDEIDAHVGGRAAVAMANMLADQSISRTKDGDIKGQVVSITHSPSVAAIADMHILIQRQRNGLQGNVPVTASVIDGTERRKELARMASGDLAPDEAQTFADALLRDGARRRRP